MAIAVKDIRGLGEVQPHVELAALAVARQFNIRNIGGFASSGHIANSDHYKGLAIDVMLGGYNVQLGNSVANWALQNGASYGVTYVIWNRRIYDRRNNKGWEAYFGTNPHTGHVHISFSPGGGSGEGPSGFVPGLPDLPNPAEPIINFVKEHALRFGMIIGGFSLIIVAFAFGGGSSALKNVVEVVE